MRTVGLAPGLSRKLKNPEVVASLNTLSTFYTGNTPQARCNLRSTIEERSLQINLDFLRASQAAQLALDRVEDEVNSLADCCDKIAKVLSCCSANTGDIINTTERLKQELEVTTPKQEIVSCFLRDDQIIPQEINAQRDEELNENFFKALSHVQEIHANCKILLRTHHQRAGLELMDMMAMYQEGAYEQQCSELLKTAVLCLKERLVLFKYCAEEVANMRHNALFRRFISVLTRGGPGGMPRPIEVHAHDPLRYVGDMLGWLHQALASECELVLALLDPDALVDTGSTANRFSKNVENDSGKIEADLTFVLDRIFKGVYLLGRETALCHTLWALNDAAQKTLFEILRSCGETLLRYPPLVAVDLSPPAAVREGVSVMLEIIEIYKSMMIPASGKRPAFDPMCEQAAEAHKSKGAGHSSRTSQMSSDSGQRSKSAVDAILSNNNSATLSQNSEAPSKIFLVNCLCAIQQPLLGHEVAAEYAKKLGAMIDNHVHVLVEKEVDTILRRCGLSVKMHHMHNSLNKDTTVWAPLAELEDTSPASLSECLKSFFGFILGSESSLPEFELMQVPKLCSDACIQVARSLTDAYELIYNAIMDPKNSYPDPKSLARHRPDQIRTILGI
ncbi:hypothetical protein CRYUN_Cryun19dG0165700 [Craigia yunnanensis]